MSNKDHKIAIRTLEGGADERGETLPPLPEPSAPAEPEKTPALSGSRKEDPVGAPPFADESLPDPEPMPG